MRKAIESMYSRLKISPNPVIGKWTLLEDFTYYRGSKGSKEKITIPAGFEFDGASVPKAFWIIGHPMEIDTLLAACIHDRIYFNGEYTRQECDEIFNEVMMICEVRTTKRVLFYIGVRLGGFIPYNNHKKARQNGKK